MTTTRLAQASPVRGIPGTIRGAQAVLLLPLGLVQLVATIVFSITEGLHGAGDYVVAVWAPVMAISCIITAMLLGRPRRPVLTAALGLLAAQAAFSVVKLAVYHESASLVFLTVIAIGAGLLVLPASRRHFLG